ncbi:hypothetical protein LTR84_002614 [Exophiala bonariae]|uniref:DNA 3'-5' helicase n=1 Tax=Exophiala bonariae TaxID=1690606 RepID=A0AAV9NA42_9EURO|nr:hypothetical protein LTR84_002614 [Exophiala bonariae]
MKLENSELKTCSAAGVAFHHGGLSPEDRRAIEDGFLQGQVNIICSTSTLAVGVNLPCYLVILKGTTCWTDNGMQEYADLEVMQMLGRAGRPQFEVSASAVILTRKEKVLHYEKMVSGEEVLESCLHQNLIEHLNAEIGLGTVYDHASAKQWLASTFLYVRLMRNASHYQFREDCQFSSKEELLDQLCQKDLSALQEADLVTRTTRLRSTEFGDAMAKYYVSFDTMKLFMELPPKAKLSEILAILVQAREFKDVRMSAGEKSFYKEINKAPEIKFPINVDIALQAHKISLLIQAELGNVTLPDRDQYKKLHQQHRLDKSIVFAQSSRLIRCIIDCQIHLEDSVSVRHALELCRCLAARVWDNTASQLRQIDGLGEVSVRKLASASIKSIDSLINAEASKIEMVLGKNPPFGLDLLKKLEAFPNLRVSVKEAGRQTKTGKGVTVRFKVEVGFLNDVKPQYFKRKPIYVCFLAETSDGRLIDFRRMSAKHLQNGEEILLSVELVKPTQQVSCFVMCDEVAGTSRYAELDLTGIPDAIYPTRQSAGSAANDSVHNSPRGNAYDTPRDDEFDDGGIEDKDLLSFEMAGEQIEVVEDIDDILEKASRQQERQVSKPLNHDSESEDAETVAFKEPTQLRNGRWTCQHDCNDRGRKCKHRCCREGVAKPRRRPKPESISKVDDMSQKKLTDLSTFNSGQSSQKRKGLNLHASVLGTQSSSAKNVHGKNDSEPPQKKSKLSHVQKSNGREATGTAPQSAHKGTVQKQVERCEPKPSPILGPGSELPNLDFLVDDLTPLDCD